MNWVQYMFVEDKYTVGCREIINDNSLPSLQNKKHYSYLVPTLNYWYADPFVIEHNNQVYIFVEMYNMWLAKGEIGVALYKDGKFSPVKSVLRKPFHMSYPNVFEFCGTMYMIPETCAIHQLQLYEATDFPYVWSLKKVLIDNIDVVDTSIMKSADGRWLVYSKENKSGGRVLWFLLEKNFSLSPIVMRWDPRERPAGNPFSIAKSFFVPLQDCGNSYGERVLIYNKCSDIMDETEKEVLSHVVDVECFSNLPDLRYSKTHTLNRSENYEVVDVHGDFIDNIKIFRKAFRKIKQLAR